MCLGLVDILTTAPETATRNAALIISNKDKNNTIELPTSRHYSTAQTIYRLNRKSPNLSLSLLNIFQISPTSFDSLDITDL